MLEQMRALAWRKESNARSVFRIVSNVTFADAVRSASPEERKQGIKLIEAGHVEGLQDWVRFLTQDLTNTELKHLASQMGIPRYSRMNTSELRRAVYEQRTSRGSTKDSGHLPRHTSGSGLQASSSGVQSKEA